MDTQTWKEGCWVRCVDVNRGSWAGASSRLEAFLKVCVCLCVFLSCGAFSELGWEERFSLINLMFTLRQSPAHILGVIFDKASWRGIFLEGS